MNTIFSPMIQEYNLKSMMGKYWSFVQLFEPQTPVTVYMVLSAGRNAAFGNFITAAYVPTTASVYLGGMAAFISFLQQELSLMGVAPLLLAARAQFNRMNARLQDAKYLRLLSLNRDFMESQNQFMTVSAPLFSVFPLRFPFSRFHSLPLF
jgi:hypothetical protein